MKDESGLGVAFHCMMKGTANGKKNKCNQTLWEEIKDKESCEGEDVSVSAGGRKSSQDASEMFHILFIFVFVLQQRRRKQSRKDHPLVFHPKTCVDFDGRVSPMASQQSQIP